GAGSATPVSSQRVNSGRLEILEQGASFMGNLGSVTGQYALGHIDHLETESLHVLREVAAEFERPVLLYSIGKDSSVLLRLAQKAFHPGRIPFPLMHVDTGYKFQAMYEFRDLIA